VHARVVHHAVHLLEAKPLYEHRKAVCSILSLTSLRSMLENTSVGALCFLKV
jgi:hypothetical protein